MSPLAKTMKIILTKTMEEIETDDGIINFPLVEYVVIDGIYTFMDRFFSTDMTDEYISNKIDADYIQRKDYITK